MVNYLRHATDSVTCVWAGVDRVRVKVYTIQYYTDSYKLYNHKNRPPSLEGGSG